MSKCRVLNCQHEQEFGCGGMCSGHHRMFMFGLIDQKGYLLCEYVSQENKCEHTGCNLMALNGQKYCFLHQHDEILFIPPFVYANLIRVSEHKFYPVEKKYLNGEIGIAEFEKYATNNFKNNRFGKKTTSENKILMRRDILSI